MSTTSNPPAASVTEPAERVRIQGPLRGLLLWFMPGTLGIFILWGAIPTVLLPLQVEQLDPVNKVANLAIVTTIGALAAMIMQPVAGTISDRTRSRFGSRAPYIVGGALFGGAALVALGFSSSILMVALCWVLVQVSFNIVQGPFSAMLPDRVPESVRGTFAAMIGAMTMVGSLGGVILASLLSASIPGAYLVLAGTSLVLLTLFAVFTGPRDNRGEPRPPFRLADAARTFWGQPGRASRFLLGLHGSTAALHRLLPRRRVPALPAAGLHRTRRGRRGPHAARLGGSLADSRACRGDLGPVERPRGRRKPFVVASSLIVALAQVVPWVWPTFEGMIVFALLAGLGFGAFQAVDTALVSQVLPDSHAHAKDLGVINIAATLPQTIAPAIAGAVVLAFGFVGLFPAAIALSVLARSPYCRFAQCAERPVRNPG